MVKRYNVLNIKIASYIAIAISLHTDFVIPYIVVKFGEGKV